MPRSSDREEGNSRKRAKAEGIACATVGLRRRFAARLWRERSREYAQWQNAVALSGSHINPDDRRSVMEISKDGHRIACEWTRRVVVHAARHKRPTRSLWNLQPALLRYTNLSHVIVTYERDRHRRKRERDQWKAVETELDGILRCAELAAAVLLQKGNPRHLTVRLQPSRRAVKRSHQERGREGEVTRVAWLDLARSTVRAIDLSHNGIRDEDTVLLAGALRINHTLTALNLSRNCIGGGGEGLAPVALAEAVGTMRALVRLDLSQNRIATKEAGHALGRALSHHGTLKELDLSNNANNATRDGGAAGFAQGIADGMKTNTALTSLHLGGNRISSAAMNGLVAIVVDTKPAMQVLCAVPFRATTLAKLDVSGQRLGAEGALVVARSLANKTNRALLSLNISNNRMATKETGSALAKALSANSVLTELDVSSNNWRKGRSYDVKKWKGDGPGFAKELANGIRTNRALTSLNLSNNNIGGAYDVHPEGWTYDDDGSGLSWKNPQGDWQEEPPPGAKQSGVVALAEALRTNEALVSVRLLSNRIGTEQANELIQMMESKENLTTLCGFSGDETELDLSGQGLSPGCGVLVANEIKHNGALTSLNVGNNHLTNDGCDMTGIKAVAAAISECKVLEKLNLGDNRIGGKDDEPGIRALAEALQINTTITELNLAFTHLDSECAYLLAPAIRSNRAMTSLDVSDNDLESEGAKHIAAAIPECEALVTVTIHKFTLPIQDIKTKTELDLSGKELGVEDAIIVAALIPLNGALTSLNISKNSIGSYWDKSKNKRIFDMTGIKALAAAIPKCKALASLIVSDNQLWGNGLKALAEALKDNQVMTEVDISNCNIIRGCFAEMWGLSALADTIPTMGALTSLDLSRNNRLGANGAKHVAEAIKVNGALYSVNISHNWIPDKQAQEIDKLVRRNRLRPIMQGRRKKSLLELDLSSRCLDHKDASVVAVYIENNGALVKLNISKNQLYAAGGRAIAEALVGNRVITELNIAGNYLGKKNRRDRTGDTSGIVALCNAIPSMRALSSLDVSQNRIRAEGAECIAAALPRCNPFLSLNLSGNNRIPAQIMARIQRELRKLRQ